MHKQAESKKLKIPLKPSMHSEYASQKWISDQFILLLEQNPIHLTVEEFWRYLIELLRRI